MQRQIPPGRAFSCTPPTLAPNLDALSVTCNLRSLDPFDGREPGRCAVVVVSRLNPVRFDGDDIPSIAGVERRSQLFLTDGVRTGIGTIVTEAQHIQSPIVLGHRR